MRAVLRTIGGVHATQGNNAVPIPVSSNPEWNEVRHKPFNTISSTDFLVDNGELQLSTIPITDMDWDDIDNKPFESIGSGLTVSEGVLSANGGGGSITLDNKSLVEVDGKVQMAVPVYSETITITPTYGPGLYLDTFTYPAGNDLDANFSAPNGFTLITGQSDFVYKVAMKLSDGTVFDGFWNADPSGSYEYGGWGQWYTNDNSYELYIANEGSGQYRLHIYMNGEYINNGNVDALVVYQIEEVSGYDDIETICTANSLTYDAITLTPRQETTYHKLPSEYYDTIPTFGNNYDTSTIDFRNTLAYSKDGNTQVMGLIAGSSINIVWSDYGDGKARALISAEIPINFIGGKLDCGQWQVLNVDSAETLNNKVVFHMDTSSIYYFYDTMGQGDFYIRNEYSCSSYDRDDYLIYGILHLGDIYNDTSAISIEGWESVFDGITYDTDHWDFTWKEGINPRGNIKGYEIYQDGKQNINAFFIPVDNSTIKVDADGNLATAIPAPPAANGTYTLQAVVNGSTITYSWI